MGALNAPIRSEEKRIPEQARGNPVYEQTRQDMPLWCCGRNCGRNSRVTVFILGIIGICASSIVCLSPHYFYFVSLRNDTFYDPEKFQPKPFRYATEANVGLFRFQILEVFEYPWPPNGQRELFDTIHNRELKRLGTFDSNDHKIPSGSGFDTFNRLLQIKFPDKFYDDDDYGVSDVDDATDNNGFSTPYANITRRQNDTLDIVLTRSPAQSPTNILEIPINEIPEVLPGSNANERLPTSMPTPTPTNGNPNDLIDVEIGLVQPYPPGSEFDKLFKNGQSGAMWAPILATIGLIFASIEFFCCVYKCSWLPTAIFLYTAFMLQLMTMFLFMSEDFCDYTQDCTLGSAGFMSVIALVCYLICQMLVCMTPRPPPKYNLLKKPPVRRKKKKKKRPNEFADDERDSQTRSQDKFTDDSMSSSRYLDPYDNQDPYNSHHGDDSYSSNYDDEKKTGYSDSYSDGYSDYYDQNGTSVDYDNYDRSYNDSKVQRIYDNTQMSGDYDDDTDLRSDGEDRQM